MIQNINYASIISARTKPSIVTYNYLNFINILMALVPSNASYLAKILRLLGVSLHQSLVTGVEMLILFVLYHHKVEYFNGILRA